MNPHLSLLKIRNNLVGSQLKWLSAPLLFSCSIAVGAQSVQGIPSDSASAYDQSITVPANPNAAKTYSTPDIPKGWINWTTYQGKWFSYKLGVALLEDYDSFWQDGTNITQVGHQRDQWDLRSARFTVGGKLGYHLPIKYLLGAEYKGLDRPPGSKGWGSTDIAITADLGRAKYGSISFGKIKETFSYEMVGDAANLPQLERLLTPFYTSRNVGVRYLNTLANKRMTISGGWFNDWWTKGNPYDGSSNHYTGRVSVLPSMSSDGSSFLHLAVASRWIGATNGQIQLTARPESNVTTVYVDTGKFNAHSLTGYSAEMLANSGPVSFLGEYIYNTTNAPTVGNPNFYGFYFEGSWVLTGEHRPYDKNVGYARRIIPSHHYGAWELVGRVGKVDLTSKAIQGGTLDAYSANVTWWPNRRYRASVGYGRYYLNRFDSIGTTDQFHGRIQWVY